MSSEAHLEPQEKLENASGSLDTQSLKSKDANDGLISQSWILTFPTSVNNLYMNHVKNGRKPYTKPYQAWMEEAGLQLMIQRIKPTCGPYVLLIEAVRPDKAKRDLGNLEKAVSDLLVRHGVVVDDHLCEEITMRWVKEAFQGVRVTVTGRLAPKR